MPDRISFDPEFNLRWFNNPGFEEMYAAWSDIFSSVDRRGNHKLKAEQALELLRDTEVAVRDATGLNMGQVQDLSRVACSYAQRLPVELELEIKEG